MTDLLDKAQSERWILTHFHPDGLCCPRCGLSVDHAHYFRTTRKSGLTVYRCPHCRQVYNLYSGTALQQRHLPPQQVVLLLRGFSKGAPLNTLAAELGLNYMSVLELRRAVQDNAGL